MSESRPISFFAGNINNHYANLQEDTDGGVLPVVNFDTYFDSTSFLKKRLTKLVKSGAIERENSSNVSRYSVNDVFVRESVYCTK